ncbi:hypothetical protein BVY04_03840 [bacterium M21]|nr:hypothetical protein BVY04_03840 [bacterium M21]
MPAKRKTALSLSLYQLTSPLRDALTVEAKDSLLTYIQSQRGCRGGFCGRNLQTDPYYTFFAVADLLILGAPISAKEIESYLSSVDEESLDLVHACSLLRTHNALRFAKLPGFLRNQGTTPLAKLGKLLMTSTSKNLLARLTALFDPDRATIYEQFLVALTLSEFGRELPAPTLAPYFAKDGGYGNAPGMDCGTTTVTAAAIMLQHANGQTIAPEMIDWLIARHLPAGGFQATPATSCADLLSTGTALAALRVIGHDLQGISADCLQFIESCQLEHGGFSATSAEATTDCEYLFYGLLGLGCLIN